MDMKPLTRVALVLLLLAAMLLFSTVACDLPPCGGYECQSGAAGCSACIK